MEKNPSSEGPYILHGYLFTVLQMCVIKIFKDSLIVIATSQNHQHAEIQEKNNLLYTLHRPIILKVREGEEGEFLFSFGHCQPYIIIPVGPSQSDCSKALSCSFIQLLCHTFPFFPVSILPLLDQADLQELWRYRIAFEQLFTFILNLTTIQ